MKVFQKKKINFDPTEFINLQHFCLHFWQMHRFWINVLSVFVRLPARLISFYFNIMLFLLTFMFYVKLTYKKKKNEKCLYDEVVIIIIPIPSSPLAGTDWWPLCHRCRFGDGRRTVRQCYQYLRSHCVVNATVNGPLAFLSFRSFSAAHADAIVWRISRRTARVQGVRRARNKTHAGQQIFKYCFKC